MSPIEVVILSLVRSSAAGEAVSRVSSAADASSTVPIPTLPGAATIFNTKWKSTLKMPCTAPKKVLISPKWKVVTNVTVPAAPKTAAKKPARAVTAAAAIPFHRDFSASVKPAQIAAAAVR